MEYEHYNPSPFGKNVGDCTVRALSKALDQDWHETYFGLCIEGALRGDMPSANATWGAYLRRNGYHRELAPEDVTVAALTIAAPATPTVASTMCVGIIAGMATPMKAGGVEAGTAVMMPKRL